MRLLAAAPLPLVSTYAYVNPAVAMVLGWMLLSEPMDWQLLAGAVLILIGVLLVVRGETSTTDQRASEPVSEDHQTDRAAQKVLE